LARKKAKKKRTLVQSPVFVSYPNWAYNAGMRYRLAQTVVFTTACLLAVRPHVNAQSSDSTASCPDSAASDGKQPSGPDVSIAEVAFSGSLQMPITDQEQIADSITQMANGTSLDGVTDDGLERVRRGWQDRGYFKVQVTGEARALTSSPVSQRVALSVRVDEGSRYNLSGITFKNNKAIPNLDMLRGLFPIKDGDIFSRERIATGLEDLRKAYGELGYINFTSVPDTKIDDENKLISLEVDFDEGKQFRVGSVKVLGVEESAREELLKTFRVGQIFSSSVWEASLLKYASMFPDRDCHKQEPRRFDEKRGIVMLTLDFRPCSAEE
jgi:outer membrane translocation and assembly module TamA